MAGEKNDVTKAESGVRYAIEQGYQVSPSAIRLMVAFMNGQGREGSLQPLVATVIEEKLRAQGSISTIKEMRTITGEDLKKFVPDVFETLDQELNVLADGNKFARADVAATNVEVMSDPTQSAQAIGIDGFAQLFKSRYEKLSRILKERPEARQIEKISQINNHKGRSRVCGLVLSKRTMKNGVELVLDDESGRTSIFAMKDEVVKAAGQVSLDACILVELEGKGGRLIAHSITQPDVPNRVAATSKKTAYAVFLSDLHVGSNKFLQGAFDRFLVWLNGRGLHEEIDDEILAHLKYVIIGGDIVDGVGVFPNQEYELVETNIAAQYDMVARKLALIPKEISILAIPGNHDSTRQALPQPSIPRKYAEGLYDLPNLRMLGDPCFVKLNGVSVLIYHGRSLDDVLAATPGLSYERPAEAMKILLKARHLAPMFGSRTPIAPEADDRLVVEQVPDIFHAGHVHSVGIERYRGTLIINSGTWQGQTSYQANLGISPRPGLVPIVNLATLEVTLREFLTSNDGLVS